MKKPCEKNKKEIEKRPSTATDIYSNTECWTKDAKVAIPTEEAVEEAKDWVDNENPK